MIDGVERDRGGMDCASVRDLIEPIAAGEMTADDLVAQHLGDCAACGAELALAREIDRLLQTRPVPVPPKHFSARTLARIRRARWQSERRLDIGFNIAIALLGVIVLGALGIVMYRTGMLAAADDAGNLLATELSALAQRAASSAPLYIVATTLVASALGLWWWIEQGDRSIG